MRASDVLSMDLLKRLSIPGELPHRLPKILEAVPTLQALTFFPRARYTAGLSKTHLSSRAPLLKDEVEPLNVTEVYVNFMHRRNMYNVFFALPIKPITVLMNVGEPGLEPINDIPGITEVNDLTRSFCSRLQKFHVWGLLDPDSVSWTSGIRILAGAAPGGLGLILSGQSVDCCLVVGERITSRV